MRFWDYGYADFNINGRICLQFSIFWGILSVFLLKCIKPVLDKFISPKVNKTNTMIDLIIFIALSIDCIVTIWGVETYENRVVYNKINNSETNNVIIKVQQNIENNYFTNERMSRTFPNLRIKDENGNEVWVKTLIND